MSGKRLGMLAWGLVAVSVDVGIYVFAAADLAVSQALARVGIDLDKRAG